MAKKKQRSRIRQNRTEWQKVFDKSPGMVQSFSWTDRLPEVLHISIALIENDYSVVKEDFFKIADYVNNKIKPLKKFHFNLSHTIKLIKQDKTIQEEIYKTCFKSAFENIFFFYREILEIEIAADFKPNFNFLLKGYHQILDGRSDISILCKYLMSQYKQYGLDDAFGIFKPTTKEEILEPLNVSTVMSSFPPLIGMSGNLDLEFCDQIWMFNYFNSPPVLRPDDSDREKKHFLDMKIDELDAEFKILFSKFKEINLTAVYTRLVAEINMGFAARICNLSIDVVELVKTHKGEIAELVLRTELESFIVGSWLLKKKDVSLYKRFRDFSTGRQRFFGEELLEKAVNKTMKKKVEEMIDDTIKEAGVREFDVASERGDIFDLRIDQMADVVWRKKQHYYFLYKRLSEVTHGHWRVIAKYHLSKSRNPTHNGLYFYNENKSRFAGLVPAFTSLIIAVEFLLSILKDISSPQTEELNEELKKLHKRLWKDWMFYFKTHVVNNKSAK